MATKYATIRQVGKVDSFTDDSVVVLWNDNESEKLDLKIVPEELLKYNPGKCFECISVRELDSWKPVKIESVLEYTQPEYTDEELQEWWDSLPRITPLEEK